MKNSLLKPWHVVGQLWGKSTEWEMYRNRVRNSLVKTFSLRVFQSIHEKISEARESEPSPPIQPTLSHEAQPLFIASAFMFCVIILIHHIWPCADYVVNKTQQCAISTLWGSRIILRTRILKIWCHMNPDTNVLSSILEFITAHCDLRIKCMKL